MHKILLIQPPYTYPTHVPVIVEMPLGLCYIASVLRMHDYEVKILDALAEDYENKTRINNNSIRVGLSYDKIRENILDFNPDIVGVSCLFTMQYDNAKDMLKLVKSINTNIVTVLGGIHATVRTGEVLNDQNLDFAIKGEGEYAFLELVNALSGKSDYSKIDGLGYKLNGKIFINDKVNFIDNLNDIPFPARDLLPVDKYHKAGKVHGFFLKGKRNFNIITSRGCPGGCIFCTIHLVWGRKFRSRSPENVLSEIKELKSKYKMNHLQFEDDNLTFDIERAKRIFNSMSGMKIKWNTPNGIAAWKLDYETLDLMKLSGCYYVKFAVESGNKHVLNKIIKKPQNIEKVIDLIRYARKIGIRVGSFFVVGFPGETKEQMQESFDFPYKVDLDWVEYSIATPHYGTELYDIAEEKGFLKDIETTDLCARKGFISTDTFTSEWLENKIKHENKKYMKHLFYKRPFLLMKIAYDTIRTDPMFVLNYIAGLIK